MDVKRGYKSKTIISVINQKISEWLKEVAKKNADLAKEISGNYFITGGAISSMLLGDKPNDYDIYFTNAETAKKVVEFYLDGIVKSDYVSRVEARIVNNNQVAIFLKSVGVLGENPDDEIDGYRYFEGEPISSLSDYIEKWATKGKKPYHPVLITSNAITLSDEIQLITRFCGDPAEIHTNFDFEHCLNYYSPETGLVLKQGSLETILARELKYVGSKYPVASLFRIRKFLERGWTITASEMVKIAFDISKLDLSDVNILKDQLIGVDLAYFHEVISILQKDSNKEIDRTYLFETLNRVFDEVEQVNWTDPIVQVEETEDDVNSKKVEELDLEIESNRKYMQYTSY